MRGGTQRRTRARVTDQIRATITDHVINHGLSYREAGERVQPNLSRDTVASIVRIFRETNRIQRLPPSGGRGKLLNEEQELAIVNMVIADNEIKLKAIQSRVVEDNLVFGNIAAISITSISRTLAKHRVRIKQLYKVPFERNSERIKELRHQYVQELVAFGTVEPYWLMEEERSKLGPDQEGPCCLNRSSRCRHMSPTGQLSLVG
ncbi:hypothetical protein QQF64_019733 [Cirrhinus molitorella]|uniref:Transposase n=1 Tax=Cirrhinus molitorella TaxID=172907 RepID=A0ABR3LJX6_9TELE